LGWCTETRIHPDAHSTGRQARPQFYSMGSVKREFRTGSHMNLTRKTNLDRILVVDKAPRGTAQTHMHDQSKHILVRVQGVQCGLQLGRELVKVQQHARPQRSTKSTICDRLQHERAHIAQRCSHIHEGRDVTTTASNTSWPILTCMLDPTHHAHTHVSHARRLRHVWRW
jgi:hypothetical protein